MTWSKWTAAASIVGLVASLGRCLSPFLLVCPGQKCMSAFECSVERFPVVADAADAVDAAADAVVVAAAADVDVVVVVVVADDVDDDVADAVDDGAVVEEVGCPMGQFHGEVLRVVSRVVSVVVPPGPSPAACS